MSEQHPKKELGFTTTKPYNQFGEFCDSCLRYRYIGVCHGVPGAGKTRSALQYSSWSRIKPLLPEQLFTLAGRSYLDGNFPHKPFASLVAPSFQEIVPCQSVYYTAPVSATASLPETGTLFLLRRAKLIDPEATLADAPPADVTTAHEISEALGGLPLALDQAGVYIEKSQRSLSDYLQRYQMRRAQLLQQRGGLVADHPEPVATTWSLSFEQAEQQSPAAGDLLRVCAFLHPDAIPEEVMARGAAHLGECLRPMDSDPFLLDEAISALGTYSLLRYERKTKTLSIHRLVQAVLQDTLKEEERDTWRARAMLAVNATFPHVEHSVWAQCERLLIQALFAAQLIKQDQVRGEEAGRLLYETASYLQDRARYGEAEPLYQRALQIREQQLGPEHPDVATSLTGLASLYSQQGRYGEVEPLYQRALQIREQQLGPEHPDVATSLNGLANLYKNQGKDAEAEPLYQRALQIREQQLGPEHPLVAQSLNDLALLYWQQGKDGEAEPLHQRALHIREQQLGPEHPLVAQSLNNLALLYRNQGKSSENKFPLRVWVGGKKGTTKERMQVVA
jgi:tetratricopeptide (TPR) repeat protein